jgi:hypothetical protein
LNFQHPARSHATAISMVVASRRAPRPPGYTLTLTTWRARNRHALREFWARPADALVVK